MAGHQQVCLVLQKNAMYDMIFAALNRVKASKNTLLIVRSVGLLIFPYQFQKIDPKRFSDLTSTCCDMTHQHCYITAAV